MAVFVNDVVTEYLTVVNPDGSAATGRVFSKLVARDPDAADFTPVVTEISNGAYKVVFTPTKVGTWYILYSVDTTPAQLWEVEVDVDAGATAGVVSATVSTGTSLAQLIRDIAWEVKDLLEATATSVSAALNTFKAADDLYEDDRFFRGAEAYFRSGTVANVGQVRRIQGSDLDTQTITFSRDLPALSQIGDVIEITNLMSNGWRRQEYKGAVNIAIRHAHPHNRVPYAANGATNYLKDGFVSIPAAFTHLYLLEWQRTDGIWVPVRYMPKAGAGWFVNYTDLSIGMRGPVASDADNRPVRFTGYARAAELSADGDVTSTDPEYLVNYAAGILILGQRKEQNAAFGQQYLNRADALRAKMAHLGKPNTIKIRD